MKKIFAAFAAFLIVILSVSPAFAYDYAYPEFEDLDYEYYERFKGQNISINVYNWGEYISNGMDDSINVNKEFEALTGIKVYYTNFATNEELYSKLKSGSVSYDIIIPSEYMIARLISENMLEPLNFDNIPNIEYINPSFLNNPHDPQNLYSVPYTWGTVGIIYNTTMVSEDDDMETWDILWNEKYMGEILMFSNPRDAFGIALKKNGFSMNTLKEEELDTAAQSLKDQKLLIQAYVMDEIFDKMIGGEAAIAPYYAGDALSMMDDNEDLAFALPREGTNQFVDGMCIPANSRQVEAAEMYINFMCEPEIGAANVEFIGYSTPNLRAYELLDEETRENEIAYPPEELQAKNEFFVELPYSTNVYIDKLWTEVLSSDAQYSELLIPIFLVIGILLSIMMNVGRSLKNKRNIY